MSVSDNTDELSYLSGVNDAIRVLKKHECVFGFEEKYIGVEPGYGPQARGRSFSKEKNDWVCRCGKTRRQFLRELKV